MNDIAQGIVDALHTVSNGTIPIYTTMQRQKFKEPCFFVEMIDSQMEHELGNRYLESATFQISYFTGMTAGDSPDYADMQGSIRPISLALEVISTREGDSLREHDITAAIDDDILHINVTYNRFIYLEGDKESYMETLALTQHTKE